MSEVPPPEPSAEQPQEQAPSPGAGQPAQPGGPVPPPGAVPPGQPAAGHRSPRHCAAAGRLPTRRRRVRAPTTPAAAGFFESLRRTGLVRTNERWIGGVAGGVARRLGLDPTLVRCIWLVLTIFSGVGLVLYGLGWALMPEESDGRIHLEQALNGDFDAGLAGALATFIAGWVLLDHGLVPSWYITGLAQSDLYNGFWPVVWSCLAVGLAYWAYRAFQRRHHQQPTPGAGLDGAGRHRVPHRTADHRG
ncbi:PspC domain-containing protein, partial [Actinomyces ruminis]